MNLADLLWGSYTSVVIGNDSVDQDGDKCDFIDATAHGGSIIGQGYLSSSLALIFSTKHGILGIKEPSVANQT